MKKQVIIWGATGQAKVLRECLSPLDNNIAALFDNNTELISPFTDVPLIFGREGFINWYGQQRDENIYFLVAIGGDKGKDRIEIQDFLESKGLIPLTAIHTTAFVASQVAIGKGTQILARSVISVETQIGRGCIINTGAIVDHECIIGDGVHICPGVSIAGCVEIGQYAMIGTGAIILPRIKIGEGAIVGAGAVVAKDVSPYSVVAGNPAQDIRRLKYERKHIFKRIKP